MADNMCNMLDDEAEYHHQLAAGLILSPTFLVNQ